MSLTFEPPGRGEWQCLVDHYPASVTLEYRKLLEATLPPGLTAALTRFGIPAKGMALVWIHGRPFIQPIPLVGRPGSLTPPRLILWAAIRLHPAARRCIRTAAYALAERPWRGDARRWYEEQRPQWIAGNLALQDEAIEPMDDDALIDHLMRARANAHAGYRLHFELHGPDFLPTGLLLARGEDWGLAHSDVFGALRGWSPASRGEDFDPALHGWRSVTSYDLDGKTFGELPGLLASSASRGKPDLDADRAAADAAATELRERVPTQDRAEFDWLLEDARLTYGIRDDNGGITGAWTVGLLRRAYLEAGRRLATAGALDDASHVFELLSDEVAALLRKQTGPAANEVAARAGQRRAESRVPAPAKIGPRQPAVPFKALPYPLALLGRAQLVIAEGLYTVPTPGSLCGLGVGDESYRGTACVALDPIEALERLKPGDILVTKATTPAWNLAISIAGALVVEEAGMLSHAAIMARELGLPAVLGVPGVTSAIADGAALEVDPKAGQVRL